MVVRKRPRVEGGERLGLGSARRAPIEEEQRVLADHGFRERCRLRQKHPMPGTIGEPGIQAVPHRPGRHDVEQSKPFDASGMIERQPIADAAAAVMAGEAKAHVSQRLHHLDHGCCHRALGVGRVLGIGGRGVGPAVAGQIRNDQAEALRQGRRNPVPHDIGLRIAMQQQERRPLPAGARKDAPGCGADPAASRSRDKGRRGRTSRPPGRNDVGLRKIIAFEQRGKIAALCEPIGKAVGED